MTSRATVLLTDYAWPDVAIESQIIEGAGLRLVTGPAKAHIAFSSDASLRDLRGKASEEVVRGLRGEPPLQGRNHPRQPPAIRP